MKTKPKPTAKKTATARSAPSEARRAKDGPTAILIPLPEGVRKRLPTALIDPHPDNRKIDPKSCKGLAASMKLFGQIQPATVRPHPDPKKKGRYQIGAGERRFHAAVINGADLDCLVCPLSDDQMAGLLVIENNQRENPDARHEATQIRRFTQSHPAATPQQIAAMLGRDESWVKRRLRLLDLIEPVHTAWTDPKHNIHPLPIASLELIAQLTPEQQAEFLNEVKHAYDTIDHDYVLSYISDLSCQLDKVTWLDNPATFVPGCGPGCATSSAAADLFSNTEFADRNTSKCAQCLNPACFKKRTDLARVHAWQLVLEKAPAGYYAITDKYSNGEVTLYDNSTLKPKQRHDFHGWSNCKKTDPAAKPFVEEKDDTVNLTWKKPPLGAATLPLAAGETAVKTEEESLQSSIDRLQGKRYTLLLDELRDHVAKAPIPEFNDLTERGIYGMVHLAACFGTHIRLNYVHGYIQDLDHGNDDASPPLTAEELDELDEQTADDRENDDDAADDERTNKRESPWDLFRQPNTSIHMVRLWKSIRKVLSERLRDRTYTDKKCTLIKPAFIQEMKEVATLTGFDFDAAYLRAANATKLPAALKHHDPVTLAKK